MTITKMLFCLLHFALLTRRQCSPLHLLSNKYCKTFWSLHLERVWFSQRIRDLRDLNDLKINMILTSRPLGTHISIRQILGQSRIYWIYWISWITDPCICFSHEPIGLNMQSPKNKKSQRFSFKRKSSKNKEIIELHNLNPKRSFKIWRWTLLRIFPEVS